MFFFIIGEVGKVPVPFAVTFSVIAFLIVAAIFVGISRWAKKYNP